MAQTQEKSNIVLVLKESRYETISPKESTKPSKEESERVLRDLVEKTKHVDFWDL